MTAGVLASARAAQDGAAQVVDLIDEGRSELDELEARVGVEPHVAVADAQHSRHQVVVGQLGVDRADDVVQARREPAAGDDGRGGRSGIEEDLARAGRPPRTDESAHGSIPGPHLCWWRMRVLSGTNPTSLSREQGRLDGAWSERLIWSSSALSMFVSDAALRTARWGQWRKWRRPVRIMAMPCSLQAATVSSSRREPPGWMIAVTPAAAATSGPSRNGKNASEASTAPRLRSPAFSTAIRTESSRLIWPAPTPRSWPSLATTIAFDLTIAQTRQAKARSRQLALGRGPARSPPGPPAGSASSRSQPWASSPPSIRRRSRPEGAGSPGRSAPSRSIRRTLFFQVGLVVSHSERLGIEAGGEDRLEEPARAAHPLGRGEVDRPVQADDAAEGADRIALVGPLEGRGQVVATAAPQGLLCLRMQAAGSANSRISRRALSRSSRLL